MSYIKDYDFSALSDAAKKVAIDALRPSQVHVDLRFLLDDFTRIAECLGLDVYTTPGPQYCDGHWATFSGRWEFRKGTMEALSSYAPKDEVLRSIAHDWVALQRKHFYQLVVVVANGVDAPAYVAEATVGNRYSSDASLDAADSLAKRLCSWLQCTANEEYVYQRTDEAVTESIEGNSVKFFEDGSLCPA